MTLAQLSPVVVVANPANVNPLAHVNHNAAAAAAGSIAQQKADKAKSDSVTISRQALEKAARGEKETDTAREAVSQYPTQNSRK